MCCLTFDILTEQKTFSQHHFKLCIQLRNMEKIIVKNPSGTSKAWDHFGFYKVEGKILKEKAVCKICHQECKYTGGTTNLNTHLQKHHSELFQTNGGAEAPKKSIPNSDYFTDEKTSCETASQF